MLNDFTFRNFVQHFVIKNDPEKLRKKSKKTNQVYTMNEKLVSPSAMGEVYAISVAIFKDSSPIRSSSRRKEYRSVLTWVINKEKRTQESNAKGDNSPFFCTNPKGFS